MVFTAVILSVQALQMGLLAVVAEALQTPAAEQTSAGTMALADAAVFAAAMALHLGSLALQISTPLQVVRLSARL